MSYFMLHSAWHNRQLGRIEMHEVVLRWATGHAQDISNAALRSLMRAIEAEENKEPRPQPEAASGVAEVV
jgi:hypothetical protein